MVGIGALQGTSLSRCPAIIKVCKVFLSHEEDRMIKFLRLIFIRWQIARIDKRILARRERVNSEYLAWRKGLK